MWNGKIVNCVEAESPVVSLFRKGNNPGPLENADRMNSKVTLQNRG